jgi:SAM-dependent methyltransferase
MDWTKDYFDDFYLKYFLQNQSSQVTKKQVNLIKDFLKPNTEILDAGCGIGRHSIKLAELGFNVLGIDSSHLYINLATKAAAEKNLQNVHFEVKDVRTIDYSEQFDGIISMWSSFGYFSDSVNYKVLENFYLALKKEGKVIIDVENRDYILKYFVRETFKEKDDIFILERRNFHALTSVVSTHRYILGKNYRRDYIRHIRIYSATEMINMFSRIGLKNIEVYGNYDKEKFSENSKRIIIVGVKA